MPDAYITDRHHLAKITQQLLTDVLDLQDRWLTEDSAACFPGTGTGGPRGTDAPNPTANTAERDHRYTDRDRIGRELLHIADRTRTLKARTGSRPTGGPCRCCHLETATHGLTSDAKPAICWPCHRYLTDNGHRCGDDVHQERIRIRWCECPDVCCTTDSDGHTACADHAEEGRRLSRRCRGRKDRGLWDRPDSAST